MDRRGGLNHHRSSQTVNNSIFEAWEQMGDDSQAPTRQNRQFHQKPLEFYYKTETKNAKLQRL